MKKLLIIFSILTTVLYAQEREVVISHYTAESGGFETLLEVVNTDFQQVASLSITAFAADGSLIDADPATREIAPGARVSFNREDLAWTGKAVSHLVINTDPQLRVSARYRAAAEGAMPADVPAAQNGASYLRFNPVSGDAWFDGLVLTNTGEQTISVDASQHDATGTTLQTVRLNLAPQSKWLGLLSQIWDQPPAGDGYVTFRSEQSFHYLVLRGSLSVDAPPVLTQVVPDTEPNEPAPKTYANQISRIVNRNCASCHHQGGIGPFPLVTYDQVSGLRYSIEEQVAGGFMPPWLPSADCDSHFLDSLEIDAAEKQMLLDWIRDGAALGDEARLPTDQTFQDPEWGLGQPDFIGVYDEPYTMEPGPDQYRCFPVAIGNTEDIQLKALDILPGNPAVVHHVLVFLDTTNAALTLDDGEAGPGYTCFGGPGTNSIRLLGAWAPGMVPIEMPDDVGLSVPAGSSLVFQVHYHSNGLLENDSTQIGLYFSETQRSKEMQMLPFANIDFTIPAGDPAYEVGQSVTLPNWLDIELYAVAPHMHLLGSSMTAKVTYNDGSETCLIDVPRWDFDWQRFYEYPEPMTIPGGSTLSFSALYDNSSDNPNNPNTPPANVSFGEATTDEMSILFIAITAPINLIKGQDGWRWPWAHMVE